MEILGGFEKEEKRKEHWLNVFSQMLTVVATDDI